MVVGVERTPERKLFLVQVENRSAETINEILRQHVRPGSIPVTDMWRGYLPPPSELRLRHLTVKYSVEFKNEETGACKNMVEGTNNGLKMKIPLGNRTQSDVGEHLLEFIWRRKHANCLWDEFLNALRSIDYNVE